MVDRWNERQIRWITAAAAILLSLVMILINVFSYRHYRDNLIQTEQGQLLTIARTIGTSLDQYLEQELEKIDLCFAANAGGNAGGEILPKAEWQDRASRMLSSGGERYRGCAGIQDGKIVFEQGNISTQIRRYARTGSSDEIPDSLREEPDISAEGMDGAAAIIGKYQAETGWYEMVVKKTIEDEEGSVSLLFAMDLNLVYQTIVSPVHIGRGGYSVVKDSDLAIIMHHAQNQIGMDALYDREEKYPELDLSSLSEWLEMQRTQDEGVGILDSYVWDDPSLTPVRRIVAYTTIDIPGEQWIVNSTLPIEELSGPLRQMIEMMALLTLIYLLLILLIAVFVTRTLTASITQEKEIRYLREINRGMELIARKNEEIRHYQRVQSLGMMSSHIAHEFNNYLTPVMVYGEMLEMDDTIDEDHRLMLREMLKSVEQAAKLSRELLDFSRMDTGGRFSALNLSAETGEAAGLLRQLASRRIIFRTEISEEPGWILGREGMMRHILMNLGKNAFHAMEDSPRKELSVNYAVNGAEAVITVSDTGCGIAPDHQKEIFEPFFTTKGSRQGTGLGLSVVRSLVENAGGAIRVESEVGSGTRFILTFPVKESAAELRVSRGIGEGRRGICVCRDRNSLDAWKDWLEGLPRVPEYTSQEVSVAARMQSGETTCGLLIIQEKLSSMSGLELAQIVRRENPDLPIVILAAQNSAELQWNVDNRIIDRVILPGAEYDPEIGLASDGSAG